MFKLLYTHIRIACDSIIGIVKDNGYVHVHMLDLDLNCLFSTMKLLYTLPGALDLSIRAPQSLLEERSIQLTRSPHFHSKLLLQSIRHSLSSPWLSQRRPYSMIF